MAKKKPRKKIPEPQIPTGERPLKFSFTHLDMEKPKFHHSKCSKAYFAKLLEVLQRYSRWRVNQFTEQDHNDHRHTIDDFSETSEPDGFSHITADDLDQFGYYRIWEIGVDPGVVYSPWRTHGVLIEDTFYLVWLDPEHALYPQ